MNKINIKKITVQNLKYNTIKELKKNNKNSIIDKLSSEIENLEMKIDIYKRLLLKDYTK